MKYIVFSVFFPFFTVAWFIVNVLHIPECEDMPTPTELIAELKNNESEAI